MVTRRLKKSHRRRIEKRGLFIAVSSSAVGMVAGAKELADAPVVIDAPVGRGHVVLVANNPMWRQETHGSFMLVMNAAMNYDHLNVGRKLPAKPKDETSNQPGDAASREEAA